MEFPFPMVLQLLKPHWETLLFIFEGHFKYVYLLLTLDVVKVANIFLIVFSLPLEIGRTLGAGMYATILLENLPLEIYDFL